MPYIWSRLPYQRLRSTPSIVRKGLSPSPASLNHTAWREWWRLLKALTLQTIQCRDDTAGMLPSASIILVDYKVSIQTVFRHRTSFQHTHKVSSSECGSWIPSSTYCGWRARVAARDPSNIVNLITTFPDLPPICTFHDPKIYSSNSLFFWFEPVEIARYLYYILPTRILR